MILHLEYEEFDMLFTGDVEKEGEESLTEILDYHRKKEDYMGNTKDCTSWIKEFYNGNISGKCKTQYAWISAGRKNRYGHPHNDTLERLEKSGAKYILHRITERLPNDSKEKNYVDSREKQLNLKSEFSILLRGERRWREPMKSLNEDIKTGNFKPVYLLYGEEAYLKKQYRDRITKAIFPDGDTVNYAYYEGKGINPGELIDLAETMPFFAERRLIVIENSGFSKMRHRSWQIISKQCRIPPVFYLWKMKQTNVERCIRLSRVKDAW